MTWRGQHLRVVVEHHVEHLNRFDPLRRSTSDNVQKSYRPVLRVEAVHRQRAEALEPGVGGADLRVDAVGVQVDSRPTVGNARQQHLAGVGEAEAEQLGDAAAEHAQPVEVQHGDVCSAATLDPSESWQRSHPSLADCCCTHCRRA